MSKRPSFQFYPGDWRNDPDLRLCSTPARGLWIEMLCLMHEGEPYGTLTRNGIALPIAALARLCGDGLSDVESWLAELRLYNVFSVSDDGVIFSRRMIRDERLRELRAAGGAAGKEHGKKGGKHGKKGGRPKKPPLAENENPPREEQETPLNGKQKPPPSSSSPSPSGEDLSLPRGDTSEVRDTHAGTRDARGAGRKS